MEEAHCFVVGQHGSSGLGDAIIGIGATVRVGSGCSCCDAECTFDVFAVLDVIDWNGFHITIVSQRCTKGCG